MSQNHIPRRDQTDHTESERLIDPRDLYASDALHAATYTSARKPRKLEAMLSDDTHFRRLGTSSESDIERNCSFRNECLALRGPCEVLAELSDSSSWPLTIYAFASASHTILLMMPILPLYFEKSIAKNRFFFNYSPSRSSFEFRMFFLGLLNDVLNHEDRNFSVVRRSSLPNTWSPTFFLKVMCLLDLQFKPIRF